MLPLTFGPLLRLFLLACHPMSASGWVPPSLGPTISQDAIQSSSDSPYVHFGYDTRPSPSSVIPPHFTRQPVYAHPDSLVETGWLYSQGLDPYTVSGPFFDDFNSSSLPSGLDYTFDQPFLPVQQPELTYSVSTFLCKPLFSY
jgi:hypothetical protein